MMQTVTSITPLHYLGQDDQTEVQNDFSSLVTPLVMVLASYDADDIVLSNGTNAHFTSRLLE